MKSDPESLEFRDLHRGSVVKIIRSPERFWVALEQVDGDRLVGRVANVLVSARHGLQLADRIEFTRDEVIDQERERLSEDDLAWLIQLSEHRDWARLIRTARTKGRWFDRAVDRGKVVPGAAPGAD